MRYTATLTTADRGLMELDGGSRYYLAILTPWFIRTSRVERREYMEASVVSQLNGNPVMGWSW